MGVVTFILLLVIAAAAAGLHTFIFAVQPPSRGQFFAACFVAYAVLLTAPALLPRLLGG